MATIRLRRFTGTDYITFPEAEAFPDGTPPYIATITLDGEDYPAILDGVGFVILTDDGNIELTDENNLDGIVEKAFSLPRELTSVALEALGFETESGAPYTVAGAIESYNYATRTATREELEGSGIDALARGIREATEPDYSRGVGPDRYPRTGY